ncbi:hypothetical protein [Sulfurihydrogenibium yellowstonense]|uniref:Uncharacterized protein n=1 Tax=Sulfurihydrogenibium yellowstonense SS-5 TaxID=432331 RepID=C4FHL5_9AQUI|nr:hypothetical protein [Sulfurihydrogenibium yellowstonense]EEP61449.1 hypothetical protein SULYE_0043 [Sulfurihydrogenibium yellowstonense SS-5]
MNSEAFNILNNESNKKIIQTQKKSTLIVCGYTDLNFSHASDATIKVILRDKSSGNYLIAYKVPVKSLGLLPIGTEIYKNEVKYTEFREVNIKHNFYKFRAYKYDELSGKEKDAISKSIYGDITKWSSGKFVAKKPYFYIFPQNKDSIIIIPDFLLLIPFYFPDDIISNITIGFKQLDSYIDTDRVDCNNKALLLKKHVPESSKLSIVLLYLYACYEEARKRQGEILIYHNIIKMKKEQIEEIELEYKSIENKEMEFYYKFPFNMETEYIFEGEYINNIFIAYRIHLIDFGIKIFYRYSGKGETSHPSLERYFEVKEVDDINIRGSDINHSLKSGIEDREFANKDFRYIGQLEKLEPERKSKNQTNNSLIPITEYSNEKINEGGFGFEKSKDGYASKMKSVENDDVDGLIDALKKHKGIKNFIDLGSWRECRVIYFVYKSKHVLVVFPVIKNSGSYLFSSRSFNFKDSFKWIVEEILRIRKRLSKFKSLDEFRKSKILNKSNIIFHPTQKYVGSKKEWIERLLEKVDKDKK